MAWINVKINKFILIFFSIIFLFSFSSGLDCGYPGSPAYGRPVPVRESYSPGSSVSYSCAYGYTLKGTHQKTCLSNGTWSGLIPICDRSLSNVNQHASTRAVYGRQSQDQQYLNIQNVIDGNKDTCTYTDHNKPRWIRVDLHENHLIEAVALTVPKSMYASSPAHLRIYVISVTNLTTHPYSGSATYHKCAEFNGKFSSTTVKLSCATGGFYGRYVHIEDQRNSIAYFALCEIDIFVQKDSYECGEPDRPSNSYTSNPEAGVIEYRCVHGYQLEGHVRRNCLPNGQWSGTQPLCIEIVCPALKPISNGLIQYGGPTKGKLVQGTVANVSCDYGYRFNKEALECLSSGQWSEGSLECEAVDCRAPAIRNDMERYILLNGSTLYGNVALFYCGDDRPDENDPLATIKVCREDGTWSDSSIECKSRNDNSVETLGLVEEDENVIPNSVIISMAVVVFALLVILLLILLFRRKQLSRRQSVESLPSKDTSSSLTMSEVKSGAPYENDAFYATITAEDSNHVKPNDNNQETNKKDGRVVERGILSTILFAKRRSNNEDKNKSKSNTSSSNNCFYEEIGVKRSGVKKGEKSENVNGDVDEASQPVYAQVDLNQKRKSRLAKTELIYSDLQFPDKSDHAKSSEDQTYRREEMPSYDSELDSEVVLRELPPIPPDDDDQSSGTYASLSKPLEPPVTLPSSILMRDNAIYEVTEKPYEKLNHHRHYMKDNDVYST